MKLTDVVRGTRGRQLCGAAEMEILHATADSRQVKPGSLFFALPGTQQDGHDYVEDALRQGAAAAVVTRTLGAPDPDKALILVDDTMTALQDLARYIRGKKDIPFIAVTGSVGKTTTKDLIAHFLSTQYATGKTQGNYNNEIGLPLSILNLEDQCQMAVVEMAMRAPGEIRLLADIARPNIAVIINVEGVHLEKLGTIENIARAKAEIMAFLQPDESAFINGDSPLLLQEAGHYHCRKIACGYNDRCDVRIKEVELEGTAIRIRASLFKQEQEFYFPYPAPRLAQNVTVAAAVALFMGVTAENIQKALLSFKPGPRRFSSYEHHSGILIIDDCYNANPLSMLNALDILSSQAAWEKRRAVAVLGDMGELGADEEEGHLAVGRRAAQLEVARLITVGEKAVHIARGAEEGGLAPERISFFYDKGKAVSYLKDHLHENDIVLFKASRGMYLETIIHELFT